MPKPVIANTSGNSVDSPNNFLTGQTNTARVYKARLDIYGQVRSFPDLIQERVFEYVTQNVKSGGLKYVTEWMCIGIGSYSSGQMVIKIARQAEFDYFKNLVLPHVVTLTINMTYSAASGNVTTDAIYSGTLIPAAETTDGATTNPVRWYTFTFSQLEAPQNISASATINTSKFVLNNKFHYTRFCSRHL